MGKEKRMIGDYTVLSSVNVGEKRKLSWLPMSKARTERNFCADLWSETTFLNRARNVW